MTEAKLVELRTELIRRQTLQAQAKAMADKALVDIQNTVDEIKKIASEHPEFYSEYPELKSITIIDTNELLNNPENIAKYKEGLTALVSKIENYLEMALNV